MKKLLVEENLWETRSLNSSDFSSLKEIVEYFYSSAHEKVFHPVGGGWSSEQLKEEIEEGMTQGLFYSPFGLTTFIIWRMIPEGYEIRLLGTHQKWRNRGLMTELLKKIFRQLKVGKEIWLEVHEKNISARNLYEKLGFFQVGLRPKYYRDGGSAILLKWQLMTESQLIPGGISSDNDLPFT